MEFWSLPGWIRTLKRVTPKLEFETCQRPTDPPHLLKFSVSSFVRHTGGVGKTSVHFVDAGNYELSFDLQGFFVTGLRNED